MGHTHVGVRACPGPAQHLGRAHAVRAPAFRNLKTHWTCLESEGRASETVHSQMHSSYVDYTHRNTCRRCVIPCCRALKGRHAGVRAQLTSSMVLMRPTALCFPVLAQETASAAVLAPTWSRRPVRRAQEAATQAGGRGRRGARRARDGARRVRHGGGADARRPALGHRGQRLARAPVGCPALPVRPFLAAFGGQAAVLRQGTGFPS